MKKKSLTRSLSIASFFVAGVVALLCDFVFGHDFTPVVFLGSWLFFLVLGMDLAERNGRENLTKFIKSIPHSSKRKHQARK